MGSLWIELAKVGHIAGSSECDNESSESHMPGIWRVAGHAVCSMLAPLENACIRALTHVGKTNKTGNVSIT